MTPEQEAYERGFKAGFAAARKELVDAQTLAQKIAPSGYHGSRAL